MSATGETPGVDDDLVADCEAFDVGTEGLDHAGDVAARNVGKRWLGQPSVVHRSRWLRALAITRIWTSSAPGGGNSICPHRYVPGDSSRIQASISTLRF